MVDIYHSKSPVSGLLKGEDLVEYRDLGRKRVEASIRSIDGLVIDVGQQGQSGQRRVVVERAEGDRTAAAGEGTITYADLAAIQHFGSVTRNIPARAHLELSTSQRQQVQRLATGELHLAIVHKTGADVGRSAGGKIGLMVQAMIRQNITDVRTPPLKASTVRARMRRRGDADPNPLVDTGRYRQSVSWTANRRGQQLGGDA